MRQHTDHSGFGQSAAHSRQGHRVSIRTRVLSREREHLHTAINLETGRPMSFGNRTAHFRRLVSENLGVRGSRVSIVLRQSHLSALPLGRLTCMVSAEHCMHLTACGVEFSMCVA